MKHRQKLLLYFLFFCVLHMEATDISTQYLYLSGRGCDEMVPWDFYCTDGRNSGRWTTIGVPSCWEMQGFGTLQYGYWWNEWNPKPHTEAVAGEHGMYKKSFLIPESWRKMRIEIVFEAVMTDAKVMVNGRLAGPVHQGGFSPFRYDITSLLRVGKENLLEVDVAKESANDKVNHAERRGDYWNFGGIIRPVYLEAKPQKCIERVAIDADMYGGFRADVLTKNMKDGSVSLQIDGRDFGSFTVNGDSTRIVAKMDNPHLWTAETPYLYTATLTLTDRRGRLKHQCRQRFGFRSVEVRPKDGLYVNGVAVKLKGVNRHSFRPETGRTLSWEKNMEDVKLIKSMNMNAVRLSHYPADSDFYELCDSLGLYVLDELTGWQNAHDTITGIRLVEELVKRDVNHPCILFWDSGNEGGFNYALEPVFQQLDPQHRMVIYPWSKTRNGLSTRHYRSYMETKKILDSGDVYMPTEFLHSAYDGGGGAGLYDYWTLMKRYNNSAGGFIWVMADEGVAVGDSIDCAGNFGPDGIVGPHHEKEASYWTVRQLWSPIQVSLLEKGLNLRNEYDFLSLEGCRLHIRQLQMPEYGGKEETVMMDSTLFCPNILPGDSAFVSIPLWAAAVMEVTAIDRHGENVCTWRFHKDIHLQSESYAENSSNVNPDFPIGRPRFIAARRSDRLRDVNVKLDRKKAQNAKEYILYEDSAVIESIRKEEGKTTIVYKNGHLRRIVWSSLSDGSVRLDYEYEMNGMVDLMGITFDYPEHLVKGKRWVGDGPYRVWQNRLHGPQYGYWENDYNNTIPGKSFDYPEFKGFFSNVSWMQLITADGAIGIINPGPKKYVGVYTPEDGIDNFLFQLPSLGISILDVIPAIRNKVDYSDLNGPSAQPYYADGIYGGTVIFRFSSPKP